MMFNAFFLNNDWYLPRQVISGVYPPGTTDIFGNDISGQEYEFTLGGPDMEFSSMYLNQMAHMTLTGKTHIQD